MKRTENWQQYINTDEDINSKRIPSIDTEIQPYIGMITSDNDRRWNRRPNSHNRLMYPISFEVNNTWKDFHLEENFLTGDECDMLISYIEEAPDDERYVWDEDNASVKRLRPNPNEMKIWNRHIDKFEFVENRNVPKINENWRNSTTTFMIPWEYGYGWYWKKTTEEIKRLNEKFWKLDISNPVTQESLQLTKYNSPSGKDYQSLRKLSYVIQLSDPKDYEGGYLQITENSNSQFNSYLMDKGRGSLIVFPSILTHRLTEVTKGIRYSAVGWVSGNHWR